jgi:hypothetical protein
MANPGYAMLQIAKALATAEEHDDPATRERAEARVARWLTILRNIRTGSVAYGSRTPVNNAPAWATLEVAGGGFATGGLLAGGPLQEHEKALIATLPPVAKGQERLALNTYFLTEAGLQDLQARLRAGTFDVTIPEEGALLVAAWLVGNGRAAEAGCLLDELIPYFDRLRFYPVPLAKPRQFGGRVRLKDVSDVIDDLKGIAPNKNILAQKEAVTVWAPFHDRVVALFMETVRDDWPCQTYPDDWRMRAVKLLDTYKSLRKTHRLCTAQDRADEHSGQLRGLLNKCAANPEALTGRDVGRIRQILKGYVAKRGAPGSAACAEARRRQAQDVAAPAFYDIVKRVVIPRLQQCAGDEGLDDVSDLMLPVAPEEARRGLPGGAAIPASIRRKVERCLNDTVAALVERGLITSGETLARVLPQVTSGIRAAGVADPALRQLYAAIYRAFRRRRSLLLLNLESQVRIEELPWIAAIDRLREGGLDASQIARQTLEEIAFLTVTSFPHMILPNKLLQEMRALAKQAGLDLPLTDELAADIFMGEFSEKFTESARRAASLLEGSLYARYYDVDYGAARRAGRAAFARLCAARAGFERRAGDVVGNGMIIEQQQIVTTQNLAVLIAGAEHGGLGLGDALSGHLDGMAKQCFAWICKRQQMKTDNWHGRLIMFKNTAYAWRQMVFYLALCPQNEVVDFLDWAEQRLGAQTKEFQEKFRPALDGLAFVAAGGDLSRRPGVRQFVGWSKIKHWLS